MMKETTTEPSRTEAKKVRKRAVAALDKPGKQLGLELMRLRAARYLTMAEVGRRVGIAESSVNNLEKGTYVAQAAVILKLAEVYGVGAEQLLALRCRCLVTRFEQRLEEEHQVLLAEWKRQGAFSFPK